MNYTMTLKTVRSFSPCAEGWATLTAAYGSDPETIVTLEQVLESNGIRNAIWAFRCLSKDDRMAMRPFIVDCAEHVLRLYEKRRTDDSRVRNYIAVTRLYIAGEATYDELTAARRDYAAYADYADAAYADYAAAAAADAAYAAYAGAGAERTWQTARLREYLAGNPVPMAGLEVK